MSYIFEIVWRHEEGAMPCIVTDEWLQNIQKDVTRQQYYMYYLFR